ncbi:MAG: TIGR02646 family protein [Muribaculaceae bacterium]|nr:TIGR02646 family protein [Muribaculaceae bacterium]
MRAISKSANIPPSLARLTPPASAKDIDSKLYKGRDVKAQLCADHFSKCVYCECRLNGDFGHIEHFRPKAGYSIPPGKQLMTPGYFWLAYDWSNLLLSCSKCNTVYKANHFALQDESARDIPNKNISNECPLLINPSTENPQAYITFHEHIIVPKIVGGIESVKGRYTIDLLQLNSRRELVEYRRKKWDEYKRWECIRAIARELIRSEQDVDHGTALLGVANDELAQMRDQRSEYSAMFLEI